ncbi:DUF4198 domain-containing protein [Paenibacillus apiarius]|uniref:DUF4198 domain-containing protein n=1 Tax=Paenibacillus apiarius TaxID=46240 RepID=A0ABT4DRZ4_9BACL|nr:DUF4198 domain-containing protein [Paenibacillus apiarius]MCY9512838.1 DUF4198 domain-containing protein [Paenibacillus apiarius]MCY9519018.1 DUF4198 domain-containing protein [Paenibacillus apiarius]MCY9550827.1 DUF4198 domain-containing protein [Paenibacillus apiarius]MCY9559739.1 DUF4198 domain-containing protein [Paenibacillus apiarius]MCY9681982.1 DUF4198 domain-containing protein [Paenibacillus apiarius]
MKKLASIAISTLLSLSIAIPAFAHDGWSQTNSPIIGEGEVSYVEMMLGNHSNEHRSYRIAGQWSTDSSKVYVLNPSGKKTDITDTRFYTGEAATEEEPAVNNYFVSSFSASKPGAYIVSVEGDSIFKHDGKASRTLRSAKSFVAVMDIPVLKRASLLKGFERLVSPDRAELVPLFSPAAVRPNQEISAQLMLKGKPLADTEVSLIRRSNSEAKTLKTDAKGTISFKTGPADYYLLRAKPTMNEQVEGQYDSVSYEATMTFIVQNGSIQLPGQPAAAQPQVFVNGKAAADQSFRFVDGTLKADAAWVKSTLGDVTGTGFVSLRDAAEKTGAVLEFLPAVGANRAAVLLYTK